ncbi:MAG: AAA family ATPase [Deltaproteobacteria bacterium]|nr:AAA family ATPase [Deltaproteobacteria bacterium]
MPKPPTKVTAPRAAYLSALCRTVPYHVVEAVLSDPTEAAIKSQHFSGSVLFADLVGFTAVCEKLAAKGGEGLSQLSEILDHLFEALLEQAMFPYEGYVVHFGGDSATVVFRGPEHAARCAASALAAQRLMHGEMGRMPGGQRHELMLRVGVASGEIHLWIVGDMIRRSIVSAGSVVHRAVALQKLAQPGAVVADRSTLDLLGADAETIERLADRGILRALRSWPATRKVASLDGRVETQIEEKIALLEPFVPQPLAEHLRSTPMGWRLPGELRDVVVLFQEISGLDDKASAPELALNVARSLLRAYRKYGGVVSKVDVAERGHRIMVLFGLHHPQENDAERALLAALDANTRLKSFTISKKQNVVVQTGVHQGKVYFGAIGSDLKHDITAVGDAVNVAARAANAAEPFEVVATDTVIEHVAEEFATAARPEILVKGRAGPLQLFAVLSAAEGKARYVRRRQFQRFCAGRRAETERLLTIAGDAARGRGRFIGVVGPAGAGKSFVLANLIDEWVAAGGIGVIGRCRYATRSLPLAPIVNIFHNFLGISASDSEAARRDRIRKGLSGFAQAEGVADLMALLEPVVRPDGTTEALSDLAEPQARERVLGAVVSFLGARAERGPVMVILEDLHLGDTLTLELAMRMSTVPRDARFLLVATYRPEPTVNEVRRVFDEEITLASLSLEQTIEVMRHELGATDIDPGVAAFVKDRTGGNPEHLIEVVRFLAGRNLLCERGGVIVPAEPGIQMLEDVVPRTLSQVVMARLEQLSVVERRLLRVASVIGQRFGRGLLELIAAADLEPGLLDDGVAKLVSHGVISPEGDGEATYVFHDDITRAVTYGTIPDGERQDVHRQIADAMERQGDKVEETSPGMLAMHRERAGDLEAAARWYQEAARIAAAAGMDRETRTLCDRFTRVVERLPVERRPASFTVAQIKVMQLVAAARLGFPGDVLRLGRELVQHHSADLDVGLRCTIDLWMGDALLHDGRPERARDRLARAFQAARDPLLRSDAARLIARTHELAHEGDKAEHWLAEARKNCGDDVFRTGRIDIARANLLADDGKLDAARAIYVRVQEAAKGAGMLQLCGQATADIAYCDMQGLRFEDARRGFAEVLGIDRALGLWRDEAADLVNLGQCHLWEGRLDEAQKHLDRGLSIALELGEQAVVAEAQVHLGLVVALTIDPEAGAAMCEDGFRKAVRAGLREVEIAGELHLLRVAIARHDVAGAEVALQRCTVHLPHMRWPLFKDVYERLKAAAGALAN